MMKRQVVLIAMMMMTSLIRLCFVLIVSPLGLKRLRWHTERLRILEKTLDTAYSALEKNNNTSNDDEDSDDDDDDGDESK